MDDIAKFYFVWWYFTILTLLGFTVKQETFQSRVYLSLFHSPDLLCALCYELSNKNEQISLPLLFSQNSDSDSKEQSNKQTTFIMSIWSDLPKMLYHMDLQSNMPWVIWIKISLLYVTVQISKTSCCVPGFCLLFSPKTKQWSHFSLVQMFPCITCALSYVFDTCLVCHISHKCHSWIHHQSSTTNPQSSPVQTLSRSQSPRLPIELTCFLFTCVHLYHFT